MKSVSYYGYIYKTTNTVNNKIYIGKHKAKKFDEEYYGSGILLEKAIEKYGKNNFIIEIIEWCKTLKELNQKEKYWIKYYHSQEKNIGYNIANGGDGGIIWGKNKHPSTTENKSGNKNGMYGKHHTLETIMKLREAHKNQKNKLKNHTKITKEENFLWVKTEEVEAYILQGWIPSKRYNKNNNKNKNKKQFHHTEETKRKISESEKGKIVSEETKNKLKETIKNKSKEEKELIKKHMKESHLGKIWVTNGIDSKQINAVELEHYVSIGFYKGRTIKTSYKKGVKNKNESQY